MGYSKILNLPIKFWKYLDINETKYWDEDNYVNQEIKTIFELVRQNDIKHHISRLYKPNLGKINSLEIVDPKDYDWIYYFIGESDHISHEFAQHSEEGKALLLKLDNFIKDRYKEFENTYKNFVFIFWSDHGHIPIVKRYNLYKVFKDEKKNLNKFFHIVDSTTVRFWINRFEDFEYIMSVMKGIPEAHLVYDNDFASLNLPKERNIYGDLFYYLDGGVTFTHTIHGHGLKVKSMHGYHPNAEGNDGLFVSNKNIDGRSASLPDIFCTISQILNLNYYPSIRLDGKNIISE
jgi:predicted AlkP superfamily pyrophosphatase or phosphodiesterase